MADLFKFRCYQCQKRIGAPASRYGKVVKCPNCQAELIVPSPDQDDDLTGSADADADREAFRPEDFGIQLEAGRLADPRPQASSPPNRETVGPDPIAYLARVADPEGSDSNRRPVVTTNQDGLEILPEPAPEPLVPRGRDRRGARGREPVARGRDVVLPRTAAVAYALFGLLGLAFAFGSGLLLGHFLWK